MLHIETTVTGKIKNLKNKIETTKITDSIKNQKNQIKTAKRNIKTLTLK